MRTATRLTGHAYPWDVLGDPGFAPRVADHGLSRVALAASYHTVRAATPLHPRHAFVDASHAAFYRRRRPEAWRGKRLVPPGAGWMRDPDSFGTAARELTEAGVDVSAWLVLTHSTFLGTRHPEVAVVNCLGNRYSYALCPAHEEVREYAATLAAEAIRDVDVQGVTIEACGQLGIVHGGHHDKMAEAWTAHDQRILSICCCRACRRDWTDRGLDPSRVVSLLRESLGRELDPQLAAVLLRQRHAATDRLRTAVVDAVRAPGLEIALHASPDPWATGALPGLTATAARDIDVVVVPAWEVNQSSLDAVSAASSVARSVDAYVTVLPPVGPDDVVEHGRRLVAAGAEGLSLYHLGLASAARQPLLSQLAALQGVPS